MDDAHNLYVADIGNQRVRMIDSFGIITTIAGTGTGGYNGDGIAATSAQVNVPNYVCTDHSGNLYISCNQDQRIRKVDAAHMITTVAGNGTGGYSGDGISATTAELNYPAGIRMDNSGNLYIADFSNQRIRKVSSSGIISTVAGTGTAGYSGDSGPATAANIKQPLGLTVDNSGNVFFSDSYFSRIRKINAATGVITTTAGNGTTGYNGDGIAATTAEVNVPDGLCFDNAGNLYIADAFNYRIRKVRLNPASILTVEPQTFSFFPNPAHNELTINTTGNITNVTIISLSGQTIYDHQFASSTVNVDITDLPKGIYFLKVNSTEVKKFLKQ